MLELFDRICDCRQLDHGFYGLAHYNRFSEEIKKHNLVEIITYLVSKRIASVAGILEFILSTPYLWINYSQKDWLRLMASLNPRPKPFQIEIFYHGYVDIHFLCRYLKINAIELFLQQEEFSLKDKKYILQYSKKINHFLFIDELDLEDLDGDYLIDYNTLKTVQHNLITNEQIKPMISTKKELIKYIDRQLDTISEF